MKTAVAAVQRLQKQIQRIVEEVGKKLDGMIAFRADHIGSLLRPRSCAKRSAHAERDALRRRRTKPSATSSACRRTAASQVVTDGEFRRISYWEKFVRLTTGLEVKPAVFKFHDAQGHESEFTAPYARAR